MQQTQNPETRTNLKMGWSRFLDPASIAFSIILAVVFLVPIFVIPSQVVSFQVSKSVIVYVGITLSLAFFLASVLKKGKLVFPTHPIFWVVGLLPVVYLISALFSGSPVSGLVGDMFDTGTFAFILAMMVLLVLVSLLFRSKEKIFYSYLVFFGAFFVVILFHIPRLIFGPDFLSLGIFNSPISNLVGKWNDLGIFFAVVTLLSLTTFEMLRLTKVFRILLYVAFVISLVFLVLVNMQAIWILLGLFSLIFFVYVFSLNRSENTFSESQPSEELSVSEELGDGRDPFSRHFSDEDSQKKISISLHSLVVLVISVIFLMSGVLGSLIPSYFGVSQVEFRPGWQGTWQVTQETIKESPILGVGPNQFVNSWLQYKPDIANQSVVWDVDFFRGVGFLSSEFVNVGVAGGVVWLAFLLLYLYIGFRAMFTHIADPASRYLVTSSFLVSLFLWIISIVYVPNLVILTLTFFFTGLFFAAIYGEKVISFRTLDLFRRPKASFVSALVVVLLLISVVASGYFVIKTAVSSIYFRTAVQTFNQTGSLDLAEQQLAQAVRLSESDIYYRSLTQINQVRLSQIVSNQDRSQEALRRDFQQVLSLAVANAQRAREYDPANYENWVALAQVYQAVVPFDIPGAYENAIDVYNKARELAPRNPGLVISQARLEIANQNIDKARELIGQAIEMKSNYTDARFLLAQIEVGQNNTEAAIRSIEQAAVGDPSNPSVFFQLGFLHYNEGSFESAISEFERAVRLAPDFANALYFLGLSYEKMDRVDLAIRQFEILQSDYPENQEVSLILSNLKAGNDPFAGAQPPIDSTPEQREAPPISEGDEDSEPDELDPDLLEEQAVSNSETEDGTETTE